jgi:hypothetical protein
LKFVALKEHQSRLALLSKDKFMLSINMKTLQFVLSFLVFLPLYPSTETTAQGQATDEFSQPRQQSLSNTYNSVAVPTILPRRITALRVSNLPTGSRITIVSDAPLDGYTAYREGEGFYLLIPRAKMLLTEKTLEGHGFSSAKVEQHGDGVLLQFHLQVGATARASQSFNVIDIFLETQAASAGSENAEGQATKTSTALLPGATSEANAGLNTDALQQMLRRIEDLEARIRELEALQAQAASLPAVASMTAAQQNAATQVLDTPMASSTNPNSSQAKTQTAATHDNHVDLPGGTPRMQIQGFAEVNFRASNEKGKTSSFSLGQLDLFITSRLSEKFSVLSELILEAGEDNAFTFEIHRLLLKYSLNDYLNLSAGRYHTSIGYYNTAYHHGSWFQTTVNRPFLFQFESKGGILPLHNVGFTATGRIPSAPLGLRYVAEIGNGRAASSPLVRPVQTAVDENNGKAFNLGIFARPSQVPGLQTGFSVYHDRLTPIGKPQVGETIMAAHLVYQNPRLEFLNELLASRHAAAGRVFYTPGFYTQFSRRFGNVRPFFRYQYVNAPSDDPIYRVGRRNGPSVGMRYDLSEFVAFKMQYDHTARRRLSALDDLILQLAFTF